MTLIRAAQTPYYYSYIYIIIIYIYIYVFTSRGVSTPLFRDRGLGVTDPQRLDVIDKLTLIPNTLISFIKTPMFSDDINNDVIH